METMDEGGIVMVKRRSRKEMGIGRSGQAR
jgi:hypothetical protein